jgi:hypothetical protein
LIQNPWITLIISWLVAWILLAMPDKLRSTRWRLVSIVVAILLVGLVSDAGDVGANISTIVLLGIILWLATSTGYNAVKTVGRSIMSRKSESTPHEYLPEDVHV